MGVMFHESLPARLRKRAAEYTDAGALVLWTKPQASVGFVAVSVALMEFAAAIDGGHRPDLIERITEGRQ
jgi:hypothetical protein